MKLIAKTQNTCSPHLLSSIVCEQHALLVGNRKKKRESPGSHDSLGAPCPQGLIEVQGNNQPTDQG